MLTEVSLGVGRDYLMKKPSGPSSPKLFLDTQVVPAAVNMAGSLEVALDGAARRVGVRPSVLVAGGAALLSLAVLRAVRPRRRLAR